MMNLLSMEEIDALIDQLNKSINLSVIELTPKEIEKLDDTLDKEMYAKEFSDVVLLYVKPLEDIYNYIISQRNKKRYVFTFDEYSIKERVRILQRELKQLGLTSEQLCELVPRNLDEANTILEAMEKGYHTTKLINNECRLMESRNYLASLENQEVIDSVPRI